jgi:hypothetical protein
MAHARKAWSCLEAKCHRRERRSPVTSVFPWWTIQVEAPPRSRSANASLGAGTRVVSLGPGLGKKPEAHRPRGGANAAVEREDGYIRHQRANQDGRGEVDGVQRSNRFRRERPPGSVHDGAVHLEDDPMGGGATQQRSPVGRDGFRKEASRDRTGEDAVTLDESERGREDELGGPEDLAHLGRFGLIQEPAHDRAGLRVQVQRSPRSSSRSLDAEPAGIAGPSDGYRSGRLGMPILACPRWTASTRPG